MLLLCHTCDRSQTTELPNTSLGVHLPGYKMESLTVDQSG